VDAAILEEIADQLDAEANRIEDEEAARPHGDRAEPLP
jgi:hypothetical protein